MDREEPVGIVPVDTGPQPVPSVPLPLPLPVATHIPTPVPLPVTGYDPERTSRRRLWTVVSIVTVVVFAAVVLGGIVWVADFIVAQAVASAGDGPVTSSLTASQVDTTAVIADVFPDFEPEGVAREPAGQWVEIVRNSDYPKVRLALPSIENLGRDLSDPAQWVFEADQTRSHAFLVTWSTSHPGTIIEMIELDPHGTGDLHLATVLYSPGPIADFGVFDCQKVASFRYMESSHNWAPVT